VNPKSLQTKFRQYQDFSAAHHQHGDQTYCRGQSEAESCVSASILCIRKLKLTVYSTSKSMVTIKVASKSPPTDQPDGLSETAQEQTFLIHKDFICHYSEFFAAAFDGQFKEGQTQAMTLDDIDPAAFALLVDWFYYQRVESDGVDLPTLARLWIMGGRFLISCCTEFGNGQDLYNFVRSN
jgi:hypothetical protein